MAHTPASGAMAPAFCGARVACARPDSARAWGGARAGQGLKDPRDPRARVRDADV